MALENVPNSRIGNEADFIRPDPAFELAVVGDAVPINYQALPWQARLAHIDETMREISKYTDPQQMVMAYARRMRGSLAPGHTLALSRRELDKPLVRLTRATLWSKQPDPWKERHMLPVFEGGILSELVHGDKPVVVPRFRADASDPAYEYLRHAKSLVAVPHFEDGQSLNMVVHTSFDENGFDVEKFPEFVQISMLFGRSTKNLVLSRDLKDAYDVLDRELKTVQDIQLSLLPTEAPAIATLDIATHYQTSTRAGGDYYDFFKLPDNRWGILVADVSGHGTPAAVLMAIVHAIAHLMPGEPMPPDRAMEFVNRALSSRYTRGGGDFVTMIYGVYDDKARTLSFANAGHPSPLLREADGTISSIEHPDAGFPLGIVEDATYGAHTVQLKPGQTLAIYTDGITEAFNSKHEMFGDARLRAAMSQGATPGDTLSAIIESVGMFAGLAARSDDRTLVVAGVR
jgi:sigma-B regulation protein RsbU (phosphoserine phosphatase)